MRVTKAKLHSYILKNYVPFQISKCQKPENLKRTLRMLEIICEYPIVNKCINEIDENDVESFLCGISATRGISKSRKNRYRSLLCAIFNHAIKGRKLYFNPVSNVKRSNEYPRGRVLSEDEMKRLLACCLESKNKELFPIVALALHTGMRYGEIIQLKRSDVKNNMIKLKASYTKTGQKRDIMLNHNIKDLLDDFMANNDNGEMIFKYKYIRRPFIKAFQQANINDFMFRDLRRTFATYLKNNGTSIGIIKSILGHSSVKMTEAYLANDNNKCLDELERLCLPI